MNPEFIQGGYNKYEHDYAERSPEQLQEKLAMYAEHTKFLTGERLRQVQSEMTRLAFEQSEVLRLSKNQQIEEAWGQHGK